MNILVTNDDGVFAPGLLALVKAMHQVGQVFVLAPDRNWSGGGHVKTLDRPLRVSEVRLENGTTAFSSDGAPSDCVALALLGYFAKKIDLVVSGINPMPNLGHDVTYSGTVTAAMEALIWGVPAIAFSLDIKGNHLNMLDFSTAGEVALQIVRRIQDQFLPKGILLNVNIPFLLEEKQATYQITRQGMRVYRDKLDKRIDPRGKPYYWISGDSPSGVPEEGTDIGALSRGYVSITPLQLDLTAYQAIDVLKEWSIQADLQNYPWTRHLTGIESVRLLPAS